jgi:hypothetical protein
MYVKFNSNLTDIFQIKQNYYAKNLKYILFDLSL